MIELLSIVCAAAAAWLWVSPRTPAERLNAVRPADGSGAEAADQPLGGAENGSAMAGVRTLGLARGGSPAEEGAPSWLARETGARSVIDRRGLLSGICAGLITGVVVGGVAGILGGTVVAGIVAKLVHRRISPEARRDSARIITDLPFAADLMVSCLQAGQPVSTATEIAAKAIPPRRRHPPNRPRHRHRRSPPRRRPGSSPSRPLLPTRLRPSRHHPRSRRPHQRIHHAVSVRKPWCNWRYVLDGSGRLA